MSPRGGQHGVEYTIKSGREIQELFRTARRVSHPLLTVLISEAPEGRGRDGRVAFVAGKKLGNAVWRNRSKRVLREAARRASAPWQGHDVVLIARSATHDASAANLDRALSDVLRRGGIT